MKLSLNFNIMARYKHIIKPIEIQILLLIITINLFKCSLCLNNMKQIRYNPKSSNFFDNDLNLSPYENIKTKRDIHPVPAPSADNFVVPDIGNLLKLLNVPGYSVYLLDLKDENNERSYKKNIIKLPLFIKPKSKSINESKLYERRLFNDSVVINDNHNKTDSGNSNDYDVNSNNDRDLKDTRKFAEETTTDIGEVTTDGEDYNETSTILPQYDDEDYGSLFNRADIPPSLLASLVG